MKPWLRWTLGILLGLALLVAGLWWHANHRGRQMWEETCAQLRAAGEPVELADIIPPHIPDEENVAAAPIFAEVFANKDTARLSDLGDAFRKGELQDANGLTIERPQGAGVPGPGDKSEVEAWLAYLRAMPSSRVPAREMEAADELLFHLSAWQDTVDDLGEAVRRPDCRWPIPYELGTRMENPVGLIASPVVRSMRPWLVAYAEKGDVEKIVQLLLTQLYWARWVHHDGSNLLTLLVAGTIRSEALNELAATLPKVTYSDSQLQLLQAELSRISLDDLLIAIRHERVMACAFMREATTGQLADLVNPVFRMPLFGPASKTDRVLGSLLVVGITRRPQGWKDADASTLAEMVQNKVLPCIDRTEGVLIRDRVDALERACNELAVDSGRFSLHRANMMASYLGTLRIQAQAQAQIAGALTGCALERYRLKHGRLPEALNELVPEFLTKVPADPVNGMPLRYVQKGERDCLVYSVGWNAVDDGGMKSKRRELGDWVWASDPRIVSYDEERQKGNPIAEALARKEAKVKKQKNERTK